MYMHVKALVKWFYTIGVLNSVNEIYLECTVIDEPNKSGD